MRRTLWIVPAATLAFGLPLASGALQAQTAPRPAPPAAFAQCTACHSTQPGKMMFGPSLAGVGGRRAASLSGYGYSPALKASGLVWNRATLDRWLTSPQKTVPGTRMPFTGIKDPAARKSVVDYLLKVPG